ncbi:YqhA family protein, partial [Acinetobacter baumannii]
TEQPASSSYRPNPRLKKVERGFETLLFNSRWLMAPIYLGLVVSLAVLLLKVGMVIFEFIVHAPGSKESDIILGVLSLIDLSLTG